MKTVKSRLFKKYLKRRKLRARFCLSLGWLNISEKKYIENYISVGAGAHKVGKVVSFCPNFDPNFPDIWNGLPLYILIVGAELHGLPKIPATLEKFS